MTALNPYTYRGIITKKEEFYGRTDIIRKLKSILKNRQCCALIGERKIGKSSILYNLMLTLKNDEAFKDLVIVYLDVSDASIKDPATFFDKVQKEVKLIITLG